MKKTLLLLLTGTVFALKAAVPTETVTPQDTTHKTEKPTEAKAVVPAKLPETKTLFVSRFYNVVTDNCVLEKLNLEKNKVYPGEYICVKTDSVGMALADKNLDTFRLWINGICYPKIKPFYANHLGSSLVFKLEVDTAKVSPWKLFYAYPNYWTFHRNVIINLGTTHKEFKNNKCERVELHTTAGWMFWVGYLMFAIFLFLILKFGKGILRDVGLYSTNGVKISYKSSEPTDKDKGIINVRDLPFSLARFQFLFWLLIIFFGIVHIWGITDELTNPTGTVLLLLGISGGTFYIGKLIDVKPSGTDTKTATEYVTEFLNTNKQSKGFVMDMLSDGKTISLHRLQLLMFTVFLGIYFTWQVIYGLALPQFSDTMMVLMGISSGTYAGIKTTES